ncbi:MAG: hypothetical protein PXY39_08105 [archaeon]|nr:hypothetical protein [archaeon]
MAQSIRRLSYIFLSISVLLFLSAIASVVFLSELGMYIALGLIVAGSFTMLLTNLLRERLKQGSAPKLSLRKALEDEDEATVS